MNNIELMNYINSVGLGKSKYMEEYDAYAINVDGYKGVAIETKEEVRISEKFFNVEISNARMTFKGKKCYALVLITRIEMTPQFSLLCNDFLAVSKRNDLMTNPFVWFNSWKQLLGTSNKNKMIYDVIGELYMLNHLQESGESPKWMSTEEGTFDIETKNALYEVKTTTNKSESLITIHNQFQLDIEKLKTDLYIAFVRVQKSEAGVSIDDLYALLVKNGYNKKELDKYLEEMGYYEGKQERYEQYLIFESRLYLVNDNFPKITASSFKDNVIPSGVIKYEYTVSLDGLEYKTIKEGDEENVKEFQLVN